MSKVVVSSLPKSGTYLLSNILKEFGFVDSGIHFGDMEYSNYKGADIKQARENPEWFRVPVPFNQAIQKLDCGEFAVGHFHHQFYQDCVANNVQVIHLSRNLKQCLYSFYYWILKTGRWTKAEQDSSWRTESDIQASLMGFLKQHQRTLLYVYSKTVRWKDEDVLHLQYEMMMQPKSIDKSIVEKIRIYLNLELSNEEVVQAINNAIQAQSLTKLDNTDRAPFNQVWNQDLEKWFCDAGFSQLEQ